MPELPSPRRITLAPRRGADGRGVPRVSLSVHDSGAGPAVVLCHGFPELAYSWIEGCGHWTRQQKPAELSRAMIDWLRRRFA